MHIERDEEFNLLYVAFKDRIAEGEVAKTEEIVPGAYIDLDSDGKLLGIEIVNTKEVLGMPVSDLHLSGELLGVKEAAELAGKDRGNFLRDLANKADFPEPVAHLASGQVWLSKDVERYLEKHNRSVHRAEKNVSLNRAAQQFSEALVHSYTTAVHRGVAAQEQNAQLTQEFFNRVIENLRTQAEDTRQMRQESMNVYMDFVNSMFTSGLKSLEAERRVGG